MTSSFDGRESLGPATTLGEAHLIAERSTRPVVVSEWKGAERRDLPGWRFYRHVIRLGLYLVERAHLQAGDRVVSLLPPSSERLILDWAVLSQAGVSVALDPTLASTELDAALRTLAPRILVVAGRDELARVEPLWAAAGFEAILVLDREASGPRAKAWVEALDLGGTLDTAERAQAFRARARAIDPAAPALGYAVDGRAGDASSWKCASHAEALRGMRDFRSRVAPASMAGRPGTSGDVAYVVGDATSMATRLALLSFVADGETVTFLGTPGREAVEMREARPQIVIAPRDVVTSARQPPRRARGPLRDLLDAVPTRVRWWRRDGAAVPQQPRVVMTLDSAPE